MATLNSLFWKYSLYQILITTLLVFRATAVNCLIKYELKAITPENEAIIHKEEVIAIQVNAFSITLLSDVTVLRKSMLLITSELLYLQLDGHNIEEIETGAFDNQNITELISLNNNKLTAIVSGTFRNMEVRAIDLNHNEITHVEENAITDMPNLIQIILCRNKIVKFHGNSFVNTPQMLIVYLQHNELGELGEKSFSFLKKKKAGFVELQYNKIEKIHPKVFEESRIWYLDLSHNKLNEVPEEMFTESLVELKLNNNTLEDLPSSFFQKKNLKVLDISDNPLKCGTLQKLKKFARENSLAIKYDNQNC